MYLHYYVNVNHDFISRFLFYLKIIIIESEKTPISNLFIGYSTFNAFIMEINYLLLNNKNNYV